MTIKRLVKTTGFSVYVPNVKRWSAVEIGFVNTDGNEDYTEFHVQHALTNDGVNELESLFNDFCKEEHVKKDSATYASIRVTADSEDSLWELAAA